MAGRRASLMELGSQVYRILRTRSIVAVHAQWTLKVRVCQGHQVSENISVTNDKKSKHVTFVAKKLEYLLLSPANIPKA